MTPITIGMPSHLALSSLSGLIYLGLVTTYQFFQATGNIIGSQTQWLISTSTTVATLNGMI